MVLYDVSVPYDDKKWWIDEIEMLASVDAEVEHAFP